MAIWQARIVVYAGHPIPGGWGDWSGFPRLCAALDRVFEGRRPESWDAGRIVWGDLVRNDAQVLLDEDEGTFCVRVDVREEFRGFLGRLSIELSALRLQVGSEGNWVEPTTMTLTSLVLESKAMRFVEDPRGFLDELGRTDDSR